MFKNFYGKGSIFTVTIPQRIVTAEPIGEVRTKAVEEKKDYREAFHAPDRDALDAYTRANATGLALGDLEWPEFADVRPCAPRIQPFPTAKLYAYVPAKPHPKAIAAMSTIAISCVMPFFIISVPFFLRLKSR